MSRVLAYPTEIVSLTSTRFFAALAVVLYHYEQALPGKALLATPVFGKGYLAVDFFFVLSGFILSHVYRGGIEDGRFKPWDFLVKRLARIYPMHLATLLFYAALAFVALKVGLNVGRPERYAPGYFFAHLFLVNAWMPVDHGTFNYPAWSVSAEWFAYLCFAAGAPWLFALIRRISPPVATIAALVLLGVVYALSRRLFGVAYGDLHSNFGFVRIMPEFLLGVSLYAVGRRAPIPLLGRRESVAVLAVVLLVSQALGAPDFISILLLAGIVMACAEQARAGTEGLLLAPPLKVLGEASYSLYLVHVPVTTVLFTLYEKAVGPVTLPVVTIGVAVAIAASLASYRLIEVPGRGAIIHFLLPRARRKPTAREAVATTEP